MNSTEEKEKEKEEEKEESTLSLSSSPKRCIVVKTKIMGREKGTINHGSEKLKESPILHPLLASSSSMMPLVQLPSFSSLERKRNKLNTIPEEILMDPALNLAIEQGLPTNYNFEIYKTIHQIKKFNIQRVALQMPEGLLMYACVIADLLETFTKVDTVIMGDVTYGACCVDDFTARALGCDFLVHYGHSCLVPIDITTLRTLYVFVDIQFEIDHFLQLIRQHFLIGTKFALVSTIQFVSQLSFIQSNLAPEYQVIIPQIKPLSPGELLGCTSPKVKDVDCIIYLGDGKFHLESFLIHNPNYPAYRYDPYTCIFTQESYDHATLHENRQTAMTQARQAKHWGLIVSTLGRQGNLEVVKYCQGFPKLQLTIGMSEILPHRLHLFHPTIDAWIQVACPRLSLDWGHCFSKPLLTPYEAMQVVLGKRDFHEQLEVSYPMDFYATEVAGGPWTVNWHRYQNWLKEKKNKTYLTSSKAST
ncbi:Diphthamide biosynthesis protein 1 [Coelomomyces lativittatus]|nr:Diphthamide biosynthesis protein 1 [Coelomomyces lativittatus]